MAVVRVGQADGLDQVFVAGYEHVSDCAIHQPAQSAKVVLTQVRTVDPQVLEHLVKDLVSPFGLDDAGLPEADQQVSERVGVEPLFAS